MSKQLTPLEILNNIKDFIIFEYSYNNIDAWSDEEIKEYVELTYNFNSIEKILKALEIIKDCCIVAEYPVLEEENKYELAFCKKICISKEEYDLLKEVLK